MIVPAIGQHRQRLTLEAPARTADGSGGAIETWTALADVYAAVEPTSGGERVAADRISGHISHEIWLRPRADLVPNLRFRQGARIFLIHAVLAVDDRNRRVKCLCEERDL